MHWYHDHRLDRTVAQRLARSRRDVDQRRRARRLAAAATRLARHPADDQRPLLRPHNQLTDPFSDSAHAPNDGIVGNRILVNGAVLPHHRVNACRYRLRILNASQLPQLQPRLRGRRHGHADRNRGGADAEAAEAAPDPDRRGRAGRPDRRLQPRQAQQRRAEERSPRQLAGRNSDHAPTRGR